MTYYLFGAQAIALSVLRAYGRKIIKAVVVSCKEGNPATLDDVPVLTIEELATSLSEQERMNSQIIIATPEDIHTDIEDILVSYGFPNYHKMDSEEWAELMGLYYRCLQIFPLLGTLPIGIKKSFMRVYAACFEKDRPLLKSVEYPEWLVPLQVGAENAVRKIARLQDNQGRNISVKNKNYCEITGLYWLWKNKLGKKPVGNDRQYYGLFQYRRMLMISEDDIYRLADNEVDVVLPYPMIYAPNISEHHKRYLSDKDWQVLLDVIGRYSPQYMCVMQDVMAQQYFYNYNVMIAERSVLNDYCQWLFDILEQVELLSSPPEQERADRYLGYMAENLATVYYLGNKNNLHIRHVGCRILI